MYNETLKYFLRNKQLKFVMAGAVNAIFAFVMSVSLYEILKGYLHIIIIGFLCSIIGITFAFMTYKLFVFKTKGNWLSEYFKCYVVYGSTSVVSVIGLWFLVDILHVKFWISNIILQAICFFLSWVGHNKFTFLR